jgi:hypothetical protein
MVNDECLIQIDFSENCSCKYSNEIQSVHFGSSHQQATLHTGVIYVDGTQEPTCFTSISPYKHQTTHPEVSVLHFFSDGPRTQYKQKGNFFLFSTELDEDLGGPEIFSNQVAAKEHQMVLVLP